MTRYMLDTNTVSHLIREHPAVVRRVLAVPMAAVCISSITKAELLFGLARRPEAERLHTAVGEFLRRVDVLPWDSEVAERYGATRAAMERQGKTLGPLDLLIASHARCAEAVLVTNDRAFAQVDGLRVEDWTADAA
ncbi:type II toxin-antitoxin system VapC family toxin [Accumulibacter sp.]|uniref:type II toxin-antitoxin system VapC family toxin n=1 Tax=Accumulibacter sp. TaxID=2053492 RepID=UPI002B734E57|nr:type II toxin-antitoxin system VapC family toxin [Accumulibacter sp.]HRF04818.1 type II toxin-antitoxin system VapC family toxin [Accumulibacter sp.]